jgi:hypothetical protein
VEVARAEPHVTQAGKILHVRAGRHGAGPVGARPSA